MTQFNFSRSPSPSPGKLGLCLFFLCTACDPVDDKRPMAPMPEAKNHSEAAFLQSESILLHDTAVG